MWCALGAGGHVVPRRWVGEGGGGVSQWCRSRWVREDGARRVQRAPVGFARGRVCLCACCVLVRVCACARVGGIRGTGIRGRGGGGRGICANEPTRPIPPAAATHRALYGHGTLADSVFRCCGAVARRDLCFPSFHAHARTPDCCGLWMAGWTCTGGDSKRGCDATEGSAARRSSSSSSDNATRGRERS